MTIRVPEDSGNDLIVRMARTAAVGGVVRDVDGEPAPGALVTAIDIKTENVRLQPRLGSDGDVAMAMTSRRGAFRLFDLPAGSYVIVAVPGADPNADAVERPTRAALDHLLGTLQRGGAVAASGDVDAFPRALLAPTFYPGTARRSQAAVVTLGEGEERNGVDIVMVHAGLSSIEGTVAGPASAATFEMMLDSIDGMRVGMSASRPRLSVAPTAKEPRFRYDNVPPGPYRVLARAIVPGMPPDGANETWFGSAGTSIDAAPIRGVVVALQRGARVRGTVRAAEGAAFSDLDLRALRLSVTPAGSAPSLMWNRPQSPARVESQGMFDLGSLAPGMYRLRVESPDRPSSPWWAVSARADGREVLDLGLLVDSRDVSIEVVLTDRPSRLEGRVTDGREAVVATNVLVFSIDRSHWSAGSRRVRAAGVAGDGSYVLDRLPPGDYYAVAVRDLAPAALEVPDFGALVPAATRIRIPADGRSMRLDLAVK